MSKTDHYMGIDLGSVSLNVVVVDGDGRVEVASYSRTAGRPLPVLLGCLEELTSKFDVFHGIVATGSGRKMVGRILGVSDVNEIVTQAKAACYFHPDVRTVIEIGGQDSKLIFVGHDGKNGETVIVDHVLNEVCAAGTGSFLDLQAHRLGIPIEEMGPLALQANHPARISGRCSVFAKSDMVHLLQEGTPKSDIVAGLCNALALNFITNLGKGKPFPKPVVFQGGVAANSGVVKAFEDRLGLAPGGLIIPRHFPVMGAFGSALMARNGMSHGPMSCHALIEGVRRALIEDPGYASKAHLAALVPRKLWAETKDLYYGLKADEVADVFLGIDIGAVSTKLVLLDRGGVLVAKQYWYAQGELVETVRAGLREMGREVGARVRVCGVGVTGSGRYFIGDFVGADVVINEISAQARAAVHCEPQVDTVIEIGGQDSKFIRCRQGRVHDFEMNKVCAAGTGSFLEEQAARLNISVRRTFSDLAFSSHGPSNLGARCTVFMESDLVHHQQNGQNINDLVAGLAYAIARNYQEKVMGAKKAGRRILFQGGVAGNPSVAAAFENVLGSPVTVPDHHNVTGAMGAALAARDRQEGFTRFAGFDVDNRPYDVKTFECGKCPNLCCIHCIYVDGVLRSYHGSLCGRYERSSLSGLSADLPDLFAERKDRLLKPSAHGKKSEKGRGRVIGIPQAMGFFDRFPFWRAFFSGLGYSVILSQETNKSLVEKGLSRVPSETCFPVKAMYGHLVDLMDQGVDTFFLPCEIDHPQRDENDARSFNCPYVQSLPYMVRASMGSAVNLITPIIRWSETRRQIDSVFHRLGRSLGRGRAETAMALNMAWQAQGRFDHWRQRRGSEVLAGIGSRDRVLVLLGKTHNIYDPGLNLHLAGKLKRQGVSVIPFDMLPLDEITLPSKYDNVVWKNSRDLLKALFWMAGDSRFAPVLLTNFGCGPDSFLMKYMETELDGNPCLVLEVDDHSGDAGMVTRIEAFLDTLAVGTKAKQIPSPSLNLIIRGKDRSLDPWGPAPDMMKRLENRTVYFPFVSRAFCSVVQTAFQAIGVEAQVLSEPDKVTEDLGRQVTSGRECHPFIVTCGEFVKLTRTPGFDPSRTAVLMQNYDGACRFSQYGIGHADLLQRLGFPEIPVIAPLTSTRFDEFSGLFGLRFTKLLWQGWLAAEVLERIRLHVRPYERVAGETDRVYARAIGAVAEAVGRPEGAPSLWNRNILEALRLGAGALKAIPVDRTEKRPIVGIVGEFYTVLNRWANHELVRMLEGLGAEVRLHGLTVPNFYAWFSGHYYPQRRLKEGKVGSALYYYARNQWAMSWVRRAEASLPPALRPAGTLSAREILSEVEPVIHHDIDPVLATLTARVRRFAASGVAGICNLYVLNCMLGNVSVPLFKHALKDFTHLPVLHASYDGQEGTNMVTRVEAFMHQVGVYATRK
jgi:predicted CoA-substrate-specific enzyme activase